MLPRGVSVSYEKNGLLNRHNNKKIWGPLGVRSVPPATLIYILGFDPFWPAFVGSFGSVLAVDEQKIRLKFIFKVIDNFDLTPAEGLAEFDRKMSKCASDSGTSVLARY